MPEQVRCPSCEAALRVPDNLLGKNVKCPKCQTTFIADIEEPAEPEGIVREPAPARRSRAPQADEEEELLEEEEQEEERPRRRKRRSVEAESLVSGPATALMVVGIIDIVLGVINLLLPLLGFSLLAIGGPGRRGGGPEDVVVPVIVYGAIGILDIFMGSLITMGALRMKKLTSHGFAMTACILAMIPCANCCLLGLPFGIWGLIVLSKPEVKDAFR